MCRQADRFRGETQATLRYVGCDEVSKEKIVKRIEFQVIAIQLLAELHYGLLKNTGLLPGITFID